MKVSDQIKGQFASVQLTFVSVMIGLVLADLVQQMRALLLPMPMTLLTAVYWGECLGIFVSAIGVFNFFSLVTITGSRLPTMGLSLLTLTVPLPLLIANGFVGSPSLWPWFAAAAIFLGLANFTTGRLIHDQAQQPGFAALLRLAGWAPSRLVIIVSIVTYLLAGLATAAGALPTWLALALTLGSGPMSALHQYLLFRDWHAALVEIDAAHLE